jgi:hypothetical protein
VPVITATYDTLLTQARIAVADYFHAAVRMLDDEFGLGFAQKNPTLVGQLVGAMAEDFTAAVKAKAIGEAAELVASAASSFAG